MTSSGRWPSKGQINWVVNKQTDKFFERYAALHKIKLVILKAIEQIENKLKTEKVTWAKWGVLFHPWNKFCGNVVYTQAVEVYHTELLRNNVFWTAINLTEEWPNALTGIVWLLFSLWGEKNIAKGCVQRNISWIITWNIFILYFPA